MQKTFFGKAVSIALGAALLMTLLPAAGWETVHAKQAYDGSVDAQDSFRLEEAETVLSDAEMESKYAQYFSREAAYSHVSVHDPSIVVGYTDAAYDGKSGTMVYGTQNEAGTRKEVYFIFGSHLAFAYTLDLKNWTTFENNIHKNYETIFEKEFAWAKRGDSVYGPSGNMWAPDVFWNAAMQKWCMYMSINGCSWNSVIVLLTADSLNGDWTYVGPVVYSGFTASGTTHSYQDTDFAGVFASDAEAAAAITDHYFREAYTCKDGETKCEATTWNNRYGAHAIDPCIVYDDDGKLWMSYGSWSGGIWMFQIDPSTGLRDKRVTYPYKANVSDPYMGYKLAGGSNVSGEASYIEKIGGKYWLFLSYGGLVASGGYNIRAFSSDRITGPYKDLQGNDARYGTSDSGYEAGAYSTKAGTANGTVGSRLMTYYKWSFLDKGRVAQGHNSAFVDDDGKAYLIYHTRFNDGSEAHEVRVHQLFTAKNGGLVTAPFEYSGETLSKTAYAMDEVAGEYQVLYQDPTVNHEALVCVQEQTMVLGTDGKVTGDFTGTWTQGADGPYVTLKLGNAEYQGVFLKQNIEGTTCEVMCFTAVSTDNDVAVWGCKGFTDEMAVVKNAKDLNANIPQDTYFDLSLPTDGMHGAKLTWSSSDTNVITNDGKVKAVSTDTNVTMTARIQKGACCYDRKYPVTVKASSGAVDLTAGLVSYYDFNNGFGDGIDSGRSGTARAAGSGTKPSLEYDKDRAGFVMHQYFGAKENASYVEYKNPLKGKELNAVTVSAWVKCEGANAWDDIWSFLDEDTGDGYSGRVYLTPNSYLGYNGTGGWFDCNHPDQGTLATITPDTWKLVTVTLAKDNFGIYVDGQPVYDKDNLNAYNAGEGQVFAYPELSENMLKVIASAEYFYTGYGSWWGSAPLLMDNLRIYERALDGLDIATLYRDELAEAEAAKAADKAEDDAIALKSHYYNSFNYAADTGFQSVNAQDRLILAGDDSREHKTYVKYDTGDQGGNRSAYHAFAYRSVLPDDKYRVEFDVQLNNARDRDSQLALANSAYGKGNDRITSGYIWEITGKQNTTDWVINGKTVTIPKDTWIHMITDISKPEKKADIIITNEVTDSVIYSGSVTFTGTADAAGIFMSNGRSYAMSAFDNIRVSSELSLSYEPEASEQPSEEPGGTEQPSEEPGGTEQPSEEPGGTEQPSEKPDPPKQGKTYAVSGIKYKVTSTKKKTVTVVGVSNKNLKKASLAKVKIKGVTFQITAIGNNAFAKCEKLQTVTVGTEVTAIGKKAFYQCSKLKTIAIQSKKLKSVGTNALKGIHKKAVIKVPKKQYKQYKKMLKNKGQGANVTIRKV